MRSIEGRKYHLLYLLFIFVFYAFLPPALTKRIYVEIRESPYKSRIFPHFYKHLQEVIRRFPSIKSIKNVFIKTYR